MIELSEKERRGRAWPGGRTGRIRIVGACASFFAPFSAVHDGWQFGQIRIGMVARTGGTREHSGEPGDGNDTDFQILDNMLSRKVSQSNLK